MKRSALLLLAVLMLISACKVTEDPANTYFEAYFEENLLPNVHAWIEDMSEKPILLIGEHHGISDNYDLYYEILSALPDQRIQLVLESPPSFAYLCNEYLKTDDESLLLNAIGHLEGTFGFAQEHYEFWKKMKELTNDGKHIEVIGVDQEFQLKNLAVALLHIDKERFTPILQRIEEAGKKGGEELLQELTTIVKEYEELPSEDKGDQAVVDIMQSLGQLVENPMGDKSRDLPLYQTFVRKVDPDIRTLGIFGGDHIMKTAESESMGSRILTEASFQERVVTAQLFYIDASYMHPKSGQATPLQGLSRDSVIVQHALKQPSDLAIYRLPKDPLFENEDLKGLSLPSLYDYALTLKDAQATQRLDLDATSN